MKHSWKHWLSIKFWLVAYAFTWYGFIGQIFIDDISVHIETSIEKVSTLLSDGNKSRLLVNDRTEALQNRLNFFPADHSHFE